MIQSLTACIIGFILDLIFGDPYWIWFHPVRLIGHLISGTENVVRKIFPHSKKGEFFAGMLLFLIVVSVSVIIPVTVLMLCYQCSKWLGIAVEGIFCYFLLATKSLKDESMKVCTALEQRGLEEARKAVSMIVGRDTERLNEEEVAKAAVETVAENTSDGIIAPLFYMILGGAGLAFFYKAINTMDSMIGYKNEKYRYFGTAAAKADDVVNFIPARLSAVFMIIAAFFMPGFDAKNGIRIYKRDRKKSPSPNAGQTESVCAGCMHIRILGDAYYFGELHKKEYMGDAGKKITPDSIRKVNRLLYGTVFVGMCFFILVKSIIAFMIY